MKVRLITLMGILAMLPACAQELEADDATALVRVMRADVMVLESFTSGLSRSTDEGHYTAAQLQCFRKLPASAFTGEIASFLAGKLSAGEIETALEFYRSPVGRKYVDIVFLALNESKRFDFKAKPLSSAYSLDPKEISIVWAFAETGAGKKLLEDQLALSPDGVAIYKKIAGKQLDACVAKIPA
jgi:hypothetical protein